MENDMPLAEHFLEGFSAEYEVQFLKKLRYVLKRGLDDSSAFRELKKTLEMIGPGFSVGSNVNLKVTFNEMQEIKEHPMASKMLIKLDQFIQMISRNDMKTIMEYSPDFSGSDDKYTQEFLESKEYKETYDTAFTLHKCLRELLDKMSN